MLILVEKHLKTTKSTKKNRIQKKKIFKKFCPSEIPPGVPRFGALGTLSEKRLDASSNLATRSMHAKFELIRTTRLPRAMGVVRNLTPLFIIGGHL